MSQETAAAALYSVNSTEAKIALAKHVVENSALDDVEKVEIKTGLNELLGVCAERNALMHHVWADSLEGPRVIDYRKPAGHKDRAKSRSVQDIALIAHRAMDAASTICSASKSAMFSAEMVADLRMLEG